MDIAKIIRRPTYTKVWRWYPGVTSIWTMLLSLPICLLSDIAGPINYVSKDIITCSIDHSARMARDWDEWIAVANNHWLGHSRNVTRYYNDPSAQVIGAFLAGLTIGLLIPKLRQPFRRFTTVDDIPLRFFTQERKIHAISVNVSDGDTFRARHIPFWRSAGSYAGKLSENTLQIRLAGIDTPETAKFGKSGQPFGEEAKEWLDATLKGKKLSLTLLHKDQYARAVCMVHYGRWPFRKNVSEEILKAGLANVYRQAGAVYGGRLNEFEAIEQKAQKQKRGIWSQGKKMETASEYKARTRASK